MPELLVTNLKLHYVDRGQGPAVILIHELGGSALTWSHLSAALVAEGFRTLALDLRGSGSSAVPTQPFSLADLASDVVALMDALRIADACLIGSAAGGSIALQVAATNPERVKAMVLIDTVASVPEGAAAYTRRRAEAVLEKGMQAAVDESMSNSFPSSATFDPAVATLYRARYLQNDPRGYAWYSLALLSADFRDTAGRLDIPALVLVGEHDRIFPPARVRELAEALPHATYEVIPGAAHFPPLQAPDLVRDRVLSFLLHERAERLQ